jgi:hypothetical protein
MRRVLICGWGPDGNDWIGRSMTLYHDAKVRFGGDEVGGIRISHMTDIDRDIEVRLTATRGKKALHVIKRLDSPLAGMLTDIENSPNAAALKDNFGASYKHMKGNEPARVQLKAAYDKRLAALTTVPPKTLQQYAEDIDNAADITIAQNTLDEAKTKLTADEVDTLQKNFDMAWEGLTHGEQHDDQDLQGDLEGRRREAPPDPRHSPQQRAVVRREQPVHRRGRQAG